MLTLLAIWLGVAAALMLVGIQQHSAGMPLAYFLGLSLIHTPGAAVYLNFPNWNTLANWTEMGFYQTVIGMVAFLVGVMTSRYLALGSRSDRLAVVWRPKDLESLDRLALIYLVGGGSYFLLQSFIAIPSVGAIIASLSSLLIVGASLRAWVAHQRGNSFRFWGAVSLLPILPAITMIKDGFIGFGTYWMLAGMSFAFAQSKQRLGYFLISPIVVFVGLSVFVSYMAARTEMRRALWYEHVDIGERALRAVNMFINFQWFDRGNSEQRNVIDARLNQNLIVGAAVERLESGAVEYAYGSTLTAMAIGLIPRALWPEKPQVGGGGTVVRDFAGMKFLPGTSVGAGQVLEFYINFGTLGVVGGFLLYGWLIGTMDLRIMECLEQGNQKGFLLWYMVCLALLQPGGNLLEIVVTVAGSAVTAYAIGYFLSSGIERSAPSNLVPSRSKENIT
jgi:hypothetical protein